MSNNSRGLFEIVAVSKESDEIVYGKKNSS